MPLISLKGGPFCGLKIHVPKGTVDFDELTLTRRVAVKPLDERHNEVTLSDHLYTLIACNGEISEEGKLLPATLEDYGHVSSVVRTVQEGNLSTLFEG